MLVSALERHVSWGDTIDGEIINVTYHTPQNKVSGTIINTPNTKYTWGLKLNYIYTFTKEDDCKLQANLRYRCKFESLSTNLMQNIYKNKINS